MWCRHALVALCFVGTPALACDYPDEGNLPLRRAVSKVKYLPDTEAWASAMHASGEVVQYAVLVDEPHREKGRCYWPVELRAGGTLWRRYYVSPDGKQVLEETAGPRPRAARSPAGSSH
jgi:hypothetical protein